MASRSLSLFEVMDKYRRSRHWGCRFGAAAWRSVGGPVRNFQFQSALSRERAFLEEGNVAFVNMAWLLLRPSPPLDIHLPADITLRKRKRNPREHRGCLSRGRGAQLRCLREDSFSLRGLWAPTCLALELQKTL
jgi:hypothetical protein